jgi:hypothetical protein
MKVGDLEKRTGLNAYAVRPTVKNAPFAALCRTSGRTGVDVQSRQVCAERK